MRTSDHFPSHGPGSRGVDGAASQLRSLRRLGVQRATLALAAAVLAGLVADVDAPLAVAFGAGSLAETLLALVSVASRRERLHELATERKAYALPEGRRFGASLTTPRRRIAVARSIAAVLRESSTGDSIYLLDRVAAQAPALSAIAGALADASVTVEPVAMAILLQILGDGSRSPLLNPDVAPEQLERTLRRIQVGIAPRSVAFRDDWHRTSRHVA